jgi:hypothetical protein
MGIRKEKSSSTNPLFIVTNKGQDVEQAEGLFDAMIKKYGIRPIFDLFTMVFDFVVENVKGHLAFEILKGLIDDFVDTLEEFLKMIDPVLAFSLIKR